MAKHDHANYIRIVSDALERTGHPRRNEVLDDLSTHLDEIIARTKQPLDMAYLIETLGPPEEYAESLAPATGYRSKPWYRRKSVRTAGVAAIAGVVVLIAVLPGPEAISARVREMFGTNYSAYPFLDLAVLRELTPGLTENEVRDAIGIPLHRAVWSGKENEIEWQYTAPPVAGAAYYTHGSAVFGKVDGRLLRTEVERHSLPSVSGGIPLSLNVGRVTLIGLDGNETVIAPGDPRPCVVAILRHAYGRIDDRVRVHHEFITERWDASMVSGVLFAYLLESESLADTPATEISTLPEGVQIFRRSKPHLSIESGETWIYSGGILYRYPQVALTGIEQITQGYYDDQAWLVRWLIRQSD
ncbi:MAG: hypothetical protein AMXMBFR84_28200 [Candidatus Hydrogenedentota bacterium]